LASFTDRIFGASPDFMKDFLVTLGSSYLVFHRRSGAFRSFRALHQRWEKSSLAELRDLQKRKLAETVKNAATKSDFYRQKYAGLDINDFESLPILEKVELQRSIDTIVIGDKRKLQPSFTGGTTGQGIVVYNGRASMQERIAVLDLFWEKHGYRQGRDRIAWVSGRPLLGSADERKKRFWRTNWLLKIRYYSTFHLAQENLASYVRNLNEYKPRFISGFPSAISDIARYIEATENTVDFEVETIFTTSETLTPEQRALFERVFRCRVANQYASSEGAPWISECREGSLHMDLTTGVFEIVDEAGAASSDGEGIVTSFLMQDTPIIRYRIGDTFRMAEPTGPCACGWQAPLVAEIGGRSADYLEVPGRGRIYNSQIGDCVKDVTSVISFQVEIVAGRLQVYLVVSSQQQFEEHDRATFLAKIRERMGDLPVDIHFVKDIPRARSGKQSMVRRA